MRFVGRYLVILLIFMFALNSLATVNIEASDDMVVSKIVSGNTAFALDLYAKLKESDKNIFFSPFSISTAFAMTYAGARGNTATQMANALHFNIDQNLLHPAFAELMKETVYDARKSKCELNIANSLWGQTGYNLHKKFLDITKIYYGSGFNEVDFIKDSEDARQKINRWVESKTNNKIRDIIGQGIFNNLTRLVLTNVIYFKGKWMFQFRKNATRDMPFTLISGEKVQIPMMHQKSKFNYAESKKLQVLEMPYKGGKLSMVVFLPKEANGIKELENSLTAASMAGYISMLENRKVIAYIPKFKMTAQFLLKDQLEVLGMADAFSNSAADFSGMTPDPVGLCISEVIHKAFIDVTEEGSEAAAATAVVVRATGISKSKDPIFIANHPLIFIIRNTHSGSILFLGRIMDPRQ